MDKQEKVATIEDLRELAGCVDFWGHSGSWDSDKLHATIQFALQQAEKVEVLDRELSEKPQPVAVVVGKLGAGIRATAFESAPRPELGQLLYDGPAVTVKLPASQRLDGNGYGYYFDMNDVFTSLEDAGIKFEVEE